MAQIKNIVRMSKEHLFVELEDGRMFQGRISVTGYARWMLVAPFPESDEEREEREQLERARAAGIEV